MVGKGKIITSKFGMLSFEGNLYKIFGGYNVKTVGENVKKWFISSTNFASFGHFYYFYSIIIEEVMERADGEPYHYVQMFISWLDFLAMGGMLPNLRDHSYIT